MRYWAAGINVLDAEGDPPCVIHQEETGLGLAQTDKVWMERVKVARARAQAMAAALNRGGPVAERVRRDLSF